MYSLKENNNGFRDKGLERNIRKAVALVLAVGMVWGSALGGFTFAKEEAKTYKWIGLQNSNKSKIEYVRNKKGKKAEYRAMAKQKLFGYDTFQGSCLNGKYRYHVLWNRTNNRARIVKVDHKKNKVIKVSKAYWTGHANDMAYDSKRNKLVIIHGDGDLKGLSVFNPENLKRTEIVKLQMPKKLPGATKKYTSKIKGITGIGYDKKNDRYIGSIKGCDDYLVLSSEFVPKAVIKTRKESTLFTRQGMDVKEGFILRAFSASNVRAEENYNLIRIYDPEGNYLKKVRLGRGYEIESIFFRGKELYASTYKSYIHEKTVKKKVRVKVKTKTGPKYRYRRKKVKVKELRRDNNVIRIRTY